MERKFIDFKDLKVSDDGPGTIEGYRAVFSEIDEGGDLIVKGFFAETIPEYLEAGFSAHSHDWTFKEAVGFPVEAKEDDHGFFVVSKFHSTDDAQDIRKKAKERMEAKKKVGFSFGYSVSDKSYIEAKDYKEQLPLYVKAERLQANLIKAQKFDRIRILKKGEVIEDSIVTAPMNKMAGATAIKSQSESKGMLADELAQTTPSTWEIESAFRRIIRKIAETAKNAPSIGESSFDWRAKVAEAVSEYGPTMQPLIIAQIEEFLDGSDDEFYLKGISESETFESFDKAASAALKKFIDNMQRNHESRVKEGRMLSTSNRATVQKCKDSLMELMTDLDALLAMSEPKPKEKAVNVIALRTQSQRLRSSATRTLAHVS